MAGEGPNGVEAGDGRAGSTPPPPPVGPQPHRLEIPNKDDKGRADPVALLIDVYTEAYHHFPKFFPKPDFRSGSVIGRGLSATLHKLGLHGVASAVSFNDRALFAPWADYLHRVEVALQTAPEGKRLEVEHFLLSTLSERVGAPQSLAHSGLAIRDEIGVFSPREFTRDDIIKGGIRITKKGEEAGFTITGEHTLGYKLDNLGRLVQAEADGLIEFTGALKALISVYQVPDDQVPIFFPMTLYNYEGAPKYTHKWQWVTLENIAEDIRRIEIHEIDVNKPEGKGYAPRVTLLNGTEVEGQAALFAIRDYEADGIVNEHFRKQAELVHAAAEAAGGRLVFAEGEEGAKRNLYLVGTGLTGEIGSATAEAAFEGAATVYMPGSSVNSSKLAAALIAKRASLRNGNFVRDDDGSVHAHIHGGRIMVGATDGLDPGRVVAAMEAVIPERQRALYAAMMYSPEGHGRELLLEVAQHAVMGRLKRDLKISGAVRLRSPTMVGRRQNLADPHRNDAAYFQGPSYQAAQLVKKWSDGVMARWNFLPISDPTGFVTATEGLTVSPVVQQVLPWAEDHGVAVARNPVTTGSFQAQSMIADLIVTPQERRPGNGTQAGRAVFDGGISQLPRPVNAQLARAMVRASAPRALVGEPKQKPKGHKVENVRVNGPVITLLERYRGQFVDIAEIPNQVLAHSKNPREGFPPFTFEMEDGTTNYVMWIKDPSEFPGAIGKQLRNIWHDSLGMIMMVNPERDIVAFIHHHGLKETPWSPYTGADLQDRMRLALAGLASVSGDEVGGRADIWVPALEPRNPKHALGGLMAKAQVIPAKDDLLPLLIELGLDDDGKIPSDFDVTKLSADQRAAIFLMGAVLMVAHKGMAMTLKYALISEALEDIEMDTAGLGGAKGIFVTPHDDASRIYALQALGVLARKTGGYISGPDEGTGALDREGKTIVLDGKPVEQWIDVMARVAPNHMSGSEDSDPMIAGLKKKTSWATATGVYEGLRSYLDDVRKTPDEGIMMVGYGGVGAPFLDMALNDHRNIVAVTDIRYESLAQVFAAYRERMGDKFDPMHPLPFLLVWDSKGAEESLPPEVYRAEWDRFHNIDFGVGIPFIEAEGLPDAIRKVNAYRLRDGKKGVGVLSPNATPHNITTEVIEAMAEVGAHAVIGAANNMMALDVNGSYEAVARLAIEKGVFIPHDSALNMMGAASVIFGAVGIIRKDGKLDEAKMKALVTIVGKRVAEEFKEAHGKGIPPQLWRDVQAMKWWNAQVDAGRAVGGKFEIPDLSEYEPTPPRGGGSGGGSGGPDVTPASRESRTLSFPPRAKREGGDPVSRALGTDSGSKKSASLPVMDSRPKDLRVAGMTTRSQQLLKLLLMAPREVFLDWIAKRGLKQEVEALRLARAPLTPGDRLDLIRAIASKDKARIATLVTMLLSKTPEGAAIGARVLHFNPAFSGVPAAASIPVRAVMIH